MVSKGPIFGLDGSLTSKPFSLAFDHISRELSRRFPSQTIRIIVSGGTCSVLYHKNRESTKDIDFFIPDPEVIEAISSCQETLPRHLKQLWPENWVNAEMAGFAMMPNCEGLYENSIANDVVLYRSEALLAYAADWKFQLIGKIMRAYQMALLKDQMQSRDRGKKDLTDAISLLDLLIKENGGPLDRSAIRSWYNGSAIEDAEIDYVNAAFQERFRFIPIL
ncbi:hypothetical protein CVT26_003746 [Gymnopilus dilepis]|uniref:Uncharacterized protein n=1 Tax=Gymnopilus dilepis TaxID=231916 RepID=A0A409VS29_9AGAR|nr:hypothetical protein CVT26_003746 [Gymnopilus dilepis]